MDVTFWLYDFLVNCVTAKDTIFKTSFGNLLERIPRGRFYQAWYTLFYESYPKVNPMFGVSKSTFYLMEFQTNKDLSWLENKIYKNRFDWSFANYGEDIGEEECCKAVLYAISGFTLFEAAAEYLQLEVQNRPNMTATAAIQIVRLFLQSMNTSEQHLLNVKSYAIQTNLSGVNHVLPSYIENEAYISNSSKRFDKCSNTKSHTCLRNINY